MVKIKITILFLIWNERVKTQFIINDFYSGYYKIHPILFYFGILYLYIYMTSKLSEKLKFYNILFILIISFSLGSLWALYQSIWGYYWSSDYIEIILLYNIIICLNIYHTIKTKIKNNKSTLLNTIIILIFLRLNLIYTKHSFFNSKKQFLYLFQFYLFLYLNNYIFTNKNYIIKLNTKNKSIILMFFIVILNKYNLKLFQTILEILLSITLVFYLLNILNLQKNKKIHLIAFLLLFIFINIKLIFISNFFMNNYKNFKLNLNYYYNFKNPKINIWKNYLNSWKFNYNWKENYFETKLCNIITIKKSKKTSLINYF